MPLQQIINRIIYLDSLVRTKSTGSVKQLAKKMNLSERAVYQYINILKDLGGPIKFCKKRSSYYYEYGGKVVMSFLPDVYQNNVGGGGGSYCRIIFFVKKPNCKNIAVCVYNLALCFKMAKALKEQYGPKLQHQLKQYSSTIHKAA
jgi:hypothetical protein